MIYNENIYMLFPNVTLCTCYQTVCKNWSENRTALKTTPLQHLSEYPSVPTRQQWDEGISGLPEMVSRQAFCDALLKSGTQWSEVEALLGSMITKEPVMSLTNSLKNVYQENQNTPLSGQTASVDSLMVHWLENVKKALPVIKVAATSPPRVEVYENEKSMLVLGGKETFTWSNTPEEWAQLVIDAIHTHPNNAKPYRVTQNNEKLQFCDRADLVGVFQQCHADVVWLGKLQSIDQVKQALHAKWVGWECGPHVCLIESAAAVTQAQMALNHWNQTKDSMLKIVNVQEPISLSGGTMLSSFANQNVWFRVQKARSALAFTNALCIDGARSMPWTPPQNFRDKMFEQDTQRQFLVVVDSKYKDHWTGLKGVGQVSELSLKQAMHSKHDALLTVDNVVNCRPKACETQPTFSDPTTVIAPPRSSLRYEAKESSPNRLISTSQHGMVWEQTDVPLDSDVWYNPGYNFMKWAMDASGTTRVPFKRFASAAFGKPCLNLSTHAFQILMHPETMAHTIKKLHSNPGFRTVIPLKPTVETASDVHQFSLEVWDSLRQETADTHLIVTSRSLLPVSSTQNILNGEHVLIKPKPVENVAVKQEVWPWVFSIGKVSFPLLKPKVYVAAFAPVKWPQLPASDIDSLAIKKLEKRVCLMLDRKSQFGQATKFVWDLANAVPETFWQSIRTVNGMGSTSKTNVAAKDLERCLDMTVNTSRMTPWKAVKSPEVIHTANWREVLQDSLPKRMPSDAATAVLAVEGPNDVMVAFCNQGIVTSESGDVWSSATNQPYRPTGSSYPLENGLELLLEQDERKTQRKPPVYFKTSKHDAPLREVSRIESRRAILPRTSKKIKSPAQTVSTFTDVPFLSTIMAQRIIDMQ